MKTTKRRAAKYWAEYFDSTPDIATSCNHMTIDCMVKFANHEIERLTKKAKTSQGDGTL